MEGNGNLPVVKFVHRIEMAIEEARAAVSYGEIVGILEIIKTGLVEEALDAACQAEDDEL